MSRIAILTISSIILTLTLSGCISPQVKAEYPEFPDTPKPQLHVISSNDLAGVPPDVVQKLVENDQKLKDHIKRLRAQIAAYMQWREEQD